MKAFVVLSPSFASHNPEKLTLELQEHVKKVTAPYKYPRKVSCVKNWSQIISMFAFSMDRLINSEACVVRSRMSVNTSSLGGGYCVCALPRTSWRYLIGRQEKEGTGLNGTLVWSIAGLLFPFQLHPFSGQIAYSDFTNFNVYRHLQFNSGASFFSPSSIRWNLSKSCQKPSQAKFEEMYWGKRSGDPFSSVLRLRQEFSAISIRLAFKMSRTKCVLNCVSFKSI